MNKSKNNFQVCKKVREILEHDGSVKITDYFARAYILADFSRTINIRGFVIILTLKI